MTCELIWSCFFGFICSHVAFAFLGVYVGCGPGLLVERWSVVYYCNGDSQRQCTA